MGPVFHPPLLSVFNWAQRRIQHLALCLAWSRCTETREAEEDKDKRERSKKGRRRGRKDAASHGEGAEIKSKRPC